MAEPPKPEVWEAIGPQMGFCGFFGGGEEDRVVVDVQYRAYLETGRGHRLAVDEQAARVVLVGGPHERAGRRRRGQARHDLHPEGVVILPADRGGTGLRVNLKESQDPLVASLHRHQERRPPVHRDNVLERGPVPLDRHPRAVEPDQPQGDVRVGGARGGIGDLPGRVRGVRGVRYPPPLHRGGVDPRDEQAGAVGCPPVAAIPSHLLGRDVLRQAVPHLGAVGLRQRPVTAAVGAHDPQRAPRHVRDAGARVVGTGIDHRPGYVQLTDRARGLVRGRAGVEAGGEQAA